MCLHVHFGAYWAFQLFVEGGQYRPRSYLIESDILPNGLAQHATAIMPPIYIQIIIHRWYPLSIRYPVDVESQKIWNPPPYAELSEWNLVCYQVKVFPPSISMIPEVDLVPKRGYSGWNNASAVLIKKRRRRWTTIPEVLIDIVLHSIPEKKNNG